ncbi:MAG: dUTP diphosphatase [Eubacterium sp.]|uniref:dUTP diphosphatase n=1 Tax=Eubacterium sp. TaxID=142586 RepID=UPI00399A349E
MNIKKLKENAVIPTYGSEYAAGADLYAAIDNPVTIAPGATEFIGTGLAMEIPMGYAGFVYARSGLSCKEGLCPCK